MRFFFLFFLLVTLALKVNAQELTETNDAQFIETSGMITRIEEVPFVVFSLKDIKGLTLKLYWFAEVDSELDMPMVFRSLLGKKVDVMYSIDAYFDPFSKEYKSVHILESVDLSFKK